MSDPRFDKMFPILRSPFRKKSTPKKDLETAVVRECLQWLAACGQVVYTERRNTGAVEFEGGGFIRFGSKGAGDIWCLLSRSAAWECENSSGNCLTHIEIECKRRSGGRLSPEQKTFKHFCSTTGIPYLVVTSVDNLIEQLKKAGLLP